MSMRRLSKPATVTTSRRPTGHPDDSQPVVYLLVSPHGERPHLECRVELRIAGVDEPLRIIASARAGRGPGCRPGRSSWIRSRCTSANAGGEVDDALRRDEVERATTTPVTHQVDRGPSGEPAGRHRVRSLHPVLRGRLELTRSPGPSPRSSASCSLRAISEASVGSGNLPVERRLARRRARRVADARPPGRCRSRDQIGTDWPDEVPLLERRAGGIDEREQSVERRDRVRPRVVVADVDHRDIAPRRCARAAGRTQLTDRRRPWLHRWRPNR